MSRSDVLVSTEWVANNANSDSVVVIEVDEDTAAYADGHVPGAVKLDWKTDLQERVNRDLLGRDQFESLLSDKGIRNSDTIILYGGNNNWFAAYAYWYFKLYGHDDVKLMDGGRKKWELEGRTLSTDSVERTSSRYVADEQNSAIRAFRDEVIAGLGTKNYLDIRTPGEFTGALLAPAHLPQEQAQRRGHIPGAVNVPWSRTVHEDGTFRSDSEIADIYIEAGIDFGKDTIAYCRIGERSSHSWFALHELLGHRNVKNYDGSWTEYGSLVGVPIESEYVT
ncbi:sulfurtransferase [Rhodococcus sp. NPDC057529]|uniref:sulfurtransferase n=1 Tax=Rhodococcus sp. NPDC057529 TaxID=3346158 RepID=UPI003671C055